MKRKTRVWLFAIAILLLIATTYEAVAIYNTPSSYLSSGRMMLAGRLTIDRQPKPAVSKSEDSHFILLLVAIYTPGLALLLFALFSRRSRVEALR